LVAERHNEAGVFFAIETHRARPLVGAAIHVDDGAFPRPLEAPCTGSVQVDAATPISDHDAGKRVAIEIIYCLLQRLPGREVVIKADTLGEGCGTAGRRRTDTDTSQKE